MEGRCSSWRLTHISRGSSEAISEFIDLEIHNLIETHLKRPNRFIDRVENAIPVSFIESILDQFGFSVKLFFFQINLFRISSTCSYHCSFCSIPLAQQPDSANPFRPILPKPSFFSAEHLPISSMLSVFLVFLISLAFSELKLTVPAYIFRKSLQTNHPHLRLFRLPLASVLFLAVFLAVY